MTNKYIAMQQRLVQIALVVDDYDEAIAFYTEKLHFELIEDTPRRPGKRWVVVAPPGDSGCRLLLAKAKNDEQRRHILRGPFTEPFGKVRGC